MKKNKKYKLNNINKNINLSIYNIYYINSENTYKYYIKYINNIYNNKNIINLIKNISKKTNSKILNIYKINYKLKFNKKNKIINRTKNILLTFLYNNNNICIYTYIENYSKNNKIYTIRTDINIYSCGLISPLFYINIILLFFKCDLININYNINGFTKYKNGKKYFINKKFNSIKKYINKNIINKYDLLELNIYQGNIFNIKMIIKKINIKKYIFKNLFKKYILNKNKKNKITKLLFKEIYEIYYS